MEIIRKKKKLSKKRLDLQAKENSKSGVEDLDTEILRLWIEKAPMLVENIRKIGLPEKGEQLRFITTKSFNAMALVDFILQNEKIEESFFCVYSIDYDSGALLSMMADQGKLGKCTFLISNLRNSAYRKKEKIIRDKFIGNKNIRLIFCGSHAKMMGFKTAPTTMSLRHRPTLRTIPGLSSICLRTVNRPTTFTWDGSILLSRLPGRRNWPFLIMMDNK